MFKIGIVFVKKKIKVGKVYDINNNDDRVSIYFDKKCLIVF